MHQRETLFSIPSLSLDSLSFTRELAAALLVLEEEVEGEIHV